MAKNTPIPDPQFNISFITFSFVIASKSDVKLSLGIIGFGN